MQEIRDKEEQGFLLSHDKVHKKLQLLVLIKEHHSTQLFGYGPWD